MLAEGCLYIDVTYYTHLPLSETVELVLLLLFQKIEKEIVINFSKDEAISDILERIFGHFWRKEARLAPFCIATQQNWDIFHLENHLSKSLKSHAAGLCVAAELGFRWASLMGVAAALVVMEKRALFRIIFLDQKKKDLFNFCGSICWLRQLSLCCCLDVSYIILESSELRRVL